MKMKKTVCILLALLLSCTGALAAAGVFSPNAYYEYLVGSAVWQLSAESQAMMQQTFAAAKGVLSEMLIKCLDESEEDWSMTIDENGKARMTYQGKPVAVLADIDDTLVDGVHYTCDIVGSDGPVNNAAFARFVLSDGCTALPGAVEFVEFCGSIGVEVFYITNRYDQGYKVGQSDSAGSYEESIAEEGRGLYIAKDGTEIGSTTYQVFGKSFFDITLESMTRLGFPIDDQHLLINDSKLNGNSKEALRTAVREGCTDHPNGQRTDGNSTGSATTFSCPAHHIALILGDQLNDFSDVFSAEGVDAVSRAELTKEYADKWGTEWFLMPNAVYGDAFDYALAYGIPELLKAYSYVK